MKKNIRNLFDLKNKVVIITGGSGFLGSEFSFALSDMGAIPVILDKNEKSLTKNDLAKIKIPVICLTNNLNEDINFYSLRGLRVEKILKPFKII